MSPIRFYRALDLRLPNQITYTAIWEDDLQTRPQGAGLRAYTQAVHAVPTEPYAALDARFELERLAKAGAVRVYADEVRAQAPALTDWLERYGDWRESIDHAPLYAITGTHLLPLT